MGVRAMPALADTRLEALRSAKPDSWVALAEDESKIVATGATYEEVVRKSEEAGVTEPLILKIPPSWSPLSVPSR
jgi:hypothetical protein